MQINVLNLSKIYHYEYEMFYNKTEAFTNFNSKDNFNIVSYIAFLKRENKGVITSYNIKPHYTNKLETNNITHSKLLFSICNYNNGDNQYFEKIKDNNDEIVFSKGFDKYIGYYESKIKLDNNRYVVR